MVLWHGRLPGGPAEELIAFSSSLAFDKRLWRDDIVATKVHVRGLAWVGLLEPGEASVIEEGLDQVAAELAGGSFPFAASDEDIHTAIERRLTEVVGDPGAKVHTGRSRNDQVCTATRLYAKRELLEVAERLIDLQACLFEIAERSKNAVMPGYTHLQRAQPVLVAHHVLAHGWALWRDFGRLLDARARLDVSPLGAGALAGSSLPLDPDWVAAELGFAGRFENSIDAVSDRDFVAEVLFVLAMIGAHLSRLAEEVVLWSTAEFGFLHLADDYATGSSMLPNKKNPDIAELARGKAGRLTGHLVAVLSMMKGLPLAYDRDLQEDKEPLFDALDQIVLAMPALTGLLSASVLDYQRLADAASSQELVALDLAEWLVERGMAFRKAHELVAGLVRRASEGAGPASEPEGGAGRVSGREGGAGSVSQPGEGRPSLADLVAADPALGPEAARLFEPGTAVRRRRTRGGSGLQAVEEQVALFAERLAAARDTLAAYRSGAGLPRDRA